MNFRRATPGLIAIGLALSLAAPGTVHAQEAKKQFVPEAQPGGPNAARKRRAQRSGPQLGGEQFVRQEAEQLAEEKWQEAFRLLKKLIQATPDSDPQKPELLYRMSEMYWERASAMDIRAYDEEERCLQASSSKDQEGACTAKRKQVEAASQGFRDRAIDVYKHIVKNYPRYPRLDGVLFALAFNYQRKGDPEAAKKIYSTLIQRYPQSEHVPDTLLNFGEILFEDGKVDQARKAYEKVVTSYRDSSVYGYSLYKLAWCYYNLSDYQTALRHFLEVIDYSKKIQGSKNRLTLLREAQRDLVRTYVNIEEASPNKAIPFFKKVAPDDYLDLSERLAEAYADTGQFEKSNELYRNLIKVQRSSYRVVSYQTSIASNTQNIGKDVLAVQELKRLVQLWRTVKDAKDAEPDRVAKDQTRIEELLRSTAVNKHLLAIKVKTDDAWALAYDLYTDYVETFPTGPHSYEMTFNFAELLYETKKWKDAAKTYEKVLELEPNGKYTKDAAHGAVLAYKKLLNIKQGGVQIDDQPSTSDAEVPAPKPISEDHQRYIEACDLYSEYVDKSEYLVDIEYDAARIYYDFNHFDKAIPRFKNIAEKHTDHRLAIFAANLLLDTYNLVKDYDALNKQVSIFLKLYTRERDPEFYDLLLKLDRQANFKNCQGVEAKKKWIEAARCYRRYAKEYPSSEFVDKALYNAALNYEREKQIEQSIQMRLALVNNVSGSELVPKALYQIAGNLHALAIYSKASEAYEYYAANFPDTEEARDALRNAAVFREGLGELDKAIENYLGYMKLVGKKDQQKASEVFFSLGRIYEKQEKWDLVINHFIKFLKDYRKDARVDLTIEAYTRIGNAYMKGKRPDSKKAQASYSKAYETFMGLSDAEKKALTTGIAPAAEARFKMGEAIFEELQRKPLEAKTQRNLKKFIEDMTKAIRERTNIVVEARKIYLEVIDFRSPNWSIAALARIGQMFQALANDIYNYPPPKSFNEEQQEIFKGQMTDQSQVPEGKAIEAYVLCLAKAQELRWFNQWSDLAEKELARLRPSEYRYNAEIRARPNHFGSTAVGQDLITALPSAEDEE